MKERIVYIDNLKALAIFSVVVGHVFYFTWNKYSDIVWNHLIVAYNMPLFFFLSGLFVKDDFSLKKLGRKAKSLLIPFFTIGGIYSFVKNGFSELFYGGSHFGYWFLPTLFTMFVLFYIRTLLINSINRCIKVSNAFACLFDIIYMLCVWGISKVLSNYIHEPIYNLLCLGNIANYILFFWMGFLVAQNKTKIWSIIRTKIEVIYAFCFILFIIIFYYNNYCCIESRGFISKILAIFVIILLMIFFKNTPIRNIKVQHVISYVGSHTLEIYVLQYFFLPVSYQLGESAMGGVNCLALSMIEGFLTIVLCVAIIKIVDINKYLNLIFFGK